MAAALDALPTAGPDGLRVEALAASLGVTKGSFYWHFEDLDDLLSGVCDHWAAKMLGVLRDHSAMDGSPEENLLYVMQDISHRHPGRYEAAIRSWAASDERAERAVREVDEARLAWTMSVFRQMGFSPEQAQIRARMMVVYEYGESELLLPASLEQRLEWARLLHEILTRAHRPRQPGDGETS